MVDNKTYWSPSRTYEFELKVGSFDLSNDLISLNIITSVDLPYQTFLLTFFVDPKDFITEEIFGQKPIKLVVKLLATDQFPQEAINFELMYLHSDMELQTQMQNPAEYQKDRTQVTISAVSRTAYITMNTIVNSIHAGTFVETAITSMVSSSGASLKYDQNGKNTEVIDQILVPPSTLYQTLRYINRTWGIYDGAPAIYCSYDNIVHIKNMTNKMRQAQTFTIYQMGTDSDNTELISKCNDGKHFYTIYPLSTKYEGNSVFALLAPTQIYVVKPRDRLFENIQINLEDFSKTKGLIDKNKTIFFDKQALKSDTRVSIHKDHTGYETDQSFINANMSQKIMNVTELNATIERSIKILNLMNVGEPVLVTSKTNEQDRLAGKYILRTSEIRFNKSKDWESSAVMNLIRTNRVIT
jgi:hypothetical protein